MSSAKLERPPTMADVAELAKVSLPTVSRVLTGATPVTEATRKRVLAAMSTLRYRPNGAARALVRGRQPIVGIVTQDVASYGASRMIKAIERAARRTGHVVAIAVLDPTDLDGTQNAVELLLSQPIVGVVVLDFHHYDQTDLLTLLGSAAVVTVTGDDDAEVPHVVVDDCSAATELTNYLLSLGHRTVHHIAVPGNGQQLHPRERGWRNALQEAGAEVPEPICTDWSIESGRVAGLSLARDLSVTAVLCANDELAFGAMRGLHDAGRPVPDAVSVVGIDDQPMASMWVPGLTTFRLDWERSAVEALELLLDSRGGFVSSSRAAGLVVRESAGRVRSASEQRRVRSPH